MGFAKNVEILKNKKITLEGLKVLYEKCECPGMVKYHGAWASNKYSAFMLIGQNPTFFNSDKDDKSTSKFYFQDSENLNILKLFFSSVDLDVEQFHITNLCKCATPDNEPLKRNIAIGCMTNYLLYELGLVSPKIIFLLGKETYETFDFLINASGMDTYKKIEDFKEEDIEKYTYYMYVTHPAACTRNASYKTTAIDSLKKYKHIFDLVERDRKWNHLHFHNHFSLHDSIIKIDEQVNFMVRNHKKEIISTNHGTLCDTFQLVDRSKNAGLKPIGGCELYCFENFKEFKAIEEPGKKREYYKKMRRHIVLIAKNEVGFKNLIKIHNFGWAEGFYYKPLVDLEFILANSEGLIAMTACVFGFISSYLLENDKYKAEDIAKKLKETFKDDLYIEIPLINWGDQVKIADDLIRIAKKIDSKIVVTGDVHYLEHADFKYRDFVYKIFLEKDTTSDDSCNDLYFKSYFDMKKVWKDKYKSDLFTEAEFETAVDNVIHILNTTEKLTLEKKSSMTSSDETEKQFEDLLEEAFKKRFGSLPDSERQKYRDRLDTEISVIHSKKLAEYFLIIYDIVKYVKGKYGPYSVGVGRGSAAGSLVNYLLSITTADPLRFNLLFERFLSLERDDLADIDIDFMPSIREDIFTYVKEKYGERKCIQIGTHAYIKLKNAIQDVSREFQIPAAEVYELTTNLGDIDESKTIEDLKDEVPILKSFLQKHPEIEEYVHKLRGIVRQFSSHAAGLIISTNVDLIESIPIMRTSNTIVTGWQDGSDYRELTALGYYKYDILGLNNIEIIQDTLKLIPKEIDLDNLNIEDKKVYDYMKSDDYMGIFQFESFLARSSLNKIIPDRFEDYVAVNALLRPGPLKAGMVDEFAKRKHKQVEWEVPKQLEETLNRTYGIIIEQEQIMAICNKVAGFTLNEANYFRKALVKYSRSLDNEIKRIEQVLSYKTQFITNATKELGEAKAKELFDLIVSFVGYGFNRSHALTYALISYYEMWLKTYYPLQFYAALLNNTDFNVKDDNFEYKIKKYMISVFNHGFTILRPDVNKSKDRFTIEGHDGLRYGLSFIKNITPNDCNIIEVNKPFSSFEDFMKKVPKKQLNKRKVEALIFSGAFDSFGDRRKLLGEFYAARKEKVDIYKINFGKQHEEFVYFDFDKMCEFFAKSKKVWDNQNLYRYMRYIKIDKILDKPHFCIISCYDLKAFYDRIFISKKVLRSKAGEMKLRTGEEVFATILREEKGFRITNLIK